MPTESILLYLQEGQHSPSNHPRVLVILDPNFTKGQSQGDSPQPLSVEESIRKMQPHGALRLELNPFKSVSLYSQPLII